MLWGAKTSKAGGTPKGGNAFCSTGCFSPVHCSSYVPSKIFQVPERPGCEQSTDQQGPIFFFQSPKSSDIPLSPGHPEGSDKSAGTVAVTNYRSFDSNFPLGRNRRRKPTRPQRSSLDSEDTLAVLSMPLFNKKADVAADEVEAAHILTEMEAMSEEQDVVEAPEGRHAAAHELGRTGEGGGRGGAPYGLEFLAHVPRRKRSGCWSVQAEAPQQSVLTTRHAVPYSPFARVQVKLLSGAPSFRAGGTHTPPRRCQDCGLVWDCLKALNKCNKCYQAHWRRVKKARIAGATSGGGLSCSSSPRPGPPMQLHLFSGHSGSSQDGSSSSDVSASHDGNAPPHVSDSPPTPHSKVSPFRCFGRALDTVAGWEKSCGSRAAGDGGPPGVCSPSSKPCPPKRVRLIEALLAAGLVQEGETVVYRARGVTSVTGRGVIRRGCIQCCRCNRMLGCTEFEQCAGSALRKPCQNIFTERGVNLQQLTQQLGPLNGPIVKGPRCPSL